MTGAAHAAVGAARARLGDRSTTAGPAATSCSDDTIGHTGFTGTGLWIDFARGLAWSLLTNRVHPTRHFDSGIAELRQAVGEAIG